MLKRAFTLIEVLIVVSIIGILAVVLTLSLTHQRQKASNARVKTDLARLKVAFEDYYNDNNCYPAPELISTCGSSALSPYLSTVPCQPDHSPYTLETDATGCVWFKLYGELNSPATDPQAMAQYSPTGSDLGNYGVSSSNTTVSVNFPLPNSSPSTPTSTHYCSAIGDCGSYDSTIWNCTPSYSNSSCDNTGCPTAGSCTPH